MLIPVLIGVGIGIFAKSAYDKKKRANEKAAGRTADDISEKFGTGNYEVKSGMFPGIGTSSYRGRRR